MGEAVLLCDRFLEAGFKCIHVERLKFLFCESGNILYILNVALTVILQQRKTLLQFI